MLNFDYKLARNKTLRVQLLVDLYGKRCFYCRYECFLPDECVPATPHDRRASCDHYVPKASGGLDRMSNYRLSCVGCNSAKGDMSPADFFEIFQETPLNPFGMVDRVRFYDACRVEHIERARPASKTYTSAPERCDDLGSLGDVLRDALG